MTCPICDQKPMNCDCTPRERAMYRELQEIGERPASPVLTDAELEAVEWAIDALVGIEDFSPGAVSADASAAATLRGLLDRMVGER